MNVDVEPITLHFYQCPKTRRLGMYINNPNDFEIELDQTFIGSIPLTQDPCVVHFRWRVVVRPGGQVLEGELDMQWPFPLDTMMSGVAEDDGVLQ